MVAQEIELSRRQSELEEFNERQQSERRLYEGEIRRLLGESAQRRNGRGIGRCLNTRAQVSCASCASLLRTGKLQFFTGNRLAEPDDDVAVDADDEAELFAELAPGERPPA